MDGEGVGDAAGDGRGAAVILKVEGSRKWYDQTGDSQWSPLESNNAQIIERWTGHSY